MTNKSSSVASVCCVLAGVLGVVTTGPGAARPVRIESGAAIAGDGRSFPTIEDGAAFVPDGKHRVVIVSAFDEPQAEAGALAAERWLSVEAPDAVRRRWTWAVLPVARRSEAPRLARWAAFQGPDLIVEIGPPGAGATPTWSDALTDDATTGLGVAPVVVVPSGGGLASALSGALANASASPSALRAHLVSRVRRDPLAIARVLARRYPQQPIMSYIPAVAWMGMLGLTGLTHEREWRDKVVEQTSPWLEGGKPLFGDKAPLTTVSGAMIFGEMKDSARAAALLAEPARVASGLKDDDTYANGRGWTDDMFMATAVLVRADRADLAARMLVEYAKRLQRPDGIFVHGTDGPWAWGRGNGFAALGLAEALASMPPGNPLRPAVLGIFRRHMAALVKAQAPDGMWNEVVGEPGSYRELTATAMIFSAMSRGIRFGWLDRSYLAAVRRAWPAIAAHVGEDGALVDVCESTGAGPTKAYYLTRKAITGADDRGGAMALMAAIEEAQSRRERLR